MAGLLPIDLQEQVACVKREIGMRERVYPNWVARGKMTQEKADHELAAMREVLDSLGKLQALEKLLSEAEAPYDPKACLPEPEARAQWEKKMEQRRALLLKAMLDLPPGDTIHVGFEELHFAAEEGPEDLAKTTGCSYKWDAYSVAYVFTKDGGDADAGRIPDARG